MNTDIINEAITKTDDNINITANNLTIDCITSTNNKFNLDSDGNLIVNSITTTTTGNTVNYDTIYPVGSIYFSTNNINPSTLFGGTWEQIKDCFILASGTKYSLGSTGGEEKHKLTVTEMPSHTHTQKGHFHKVTSRMDNTNGTNRGGEFGINRGTLISGGDYYNLETQGTSNDLATNARVGALPTTAVNNNTGGNQTHNNMPPYLVVNIWKRIS